MLVSKTATVVWNARNKTHYIDRGYTFTRMKDSFEVCVNDLTIGSQAIVQIKCDYCGDTFHRAWYTQIGLQRKRFDKSDCCGKQECLQRKARESICGKYGGYAEMHNASNDKRMSTTMERYGVTNPFSNQEIKNRIVETNLSKYGVPYTQQSAEIRRKTVETCRKKYGVDNYVELFRGKHIKDNSPNWKGGVEYSRVERSTYEYRQWRNSVFSRDKYRCRKCGSKNGETGHSVELNAHHIMNWKDVPSLRYDVENGITLCDSCHIKFHSRYGKRNNTKKQIEEFLFSDKNVC